MDPRSFLRAIESQHLLQTTSLHGLQGLNGLLNNHLLPLQSSSSPSSEAPSDIADHRARSQRLTKLAREESLLEAQVIQIILSDACEETLRPNSRRSVSVGGHSICVVFRDDVASGYRIWEWHGHILIFDDERGYTPEYIYGNFFQILQSSVNINGSSNNDSILNGVGLSAVILNGDSQSHEQVVHRAAASSQTKKK